MAAAKPEIRQAAAELTALAVAVRPDWDEQWIVSAVQKATLRGMTWPQVLTTLTRLMADPKAQPRDLVADAWSPLASRHAPVPPSDEWRAARQQMGRAS